MQKPRLKPFVRTLEGRLLTLTTDPGVTFQIEDPDGQSGRLLDLLDGSRTLAEIDLPGLTPAEIAEGIATLDEAGLLEDAAAPALQDPERYFNNLAFFGTYADMTTSRHQFQDRLARARVLQIGTGGVGSTVLLQLVGLGVGEIRLIEFDRVERKNLVRQLLFTEADLAQPKLNAAVARARALNPAVRIEGISRQITGPEDLIELMEGVDLLVLTADSPSTITAWANEAAVARGVPFITGGVGIAQAAYYSVSPGKSGCLACLRCEAMLIDARTRLFFLPLSIVEDEAEFLVGHADSGTFLAMPVIGVWLLKCGVSLREDQGDQGRAGQGDRSRHPHPQLALYIGRGLPLNSGRPLAYSCAISSSELPSGSRREPSRRPPSLVISPRSSPPASTAAAR